MKQLMEGHKPVAKGRKALKNPWDFNASTEEVKAYTNGGMGDYYGSGIRQPVGKQRSPTVGLTPLTPKELRIPPTSVV